MTYLPYQQLIDIKQWADRALCAAVKQNLHRLSREEMEIVIRVFDHIHSVDRIFQHHLQGRPHDFRAAQSETPPAFDVLVEAMMELDDWYVAYVANLPPGAFEDIVAFTFTSGKTARMRRGEILLHIALHGTYHRGNVGAVLQIKGLKPGRDSITDYLEETSDGADLRIAEAGRNA